MRIDKLLWYLRFFKTRGTAQKLVEGGLVRVNGQRIERAHFAVKLGDIVTFPMGSKVSIIELSALPVRRGPASEAQSCYRALDEEAHLPLAGHNLSTLPQGDLQP